MDAQVKQLTKTIANLSDKMSRLEEIEHGLVKKNNSDNDINSERECTIKASLRAANKTIAILRTSCADTHLLDLLTPKDVPESTTKLHRLDENTNVKYKMTASEAASTNATPFRILLEAAAGEDDFKYIFWTFSTSF